MSSIVQRLTERQLIKPMPPRFLENNIHYETMMGSVAYGVSDDTSDCDVYGFCIPPKHFIFPHTVGHIHGFGKQPEAFHNFQVHHIKDNDARGGDGKEYDIDIYNIVVYFQLLMENNPNLVDSIFTPTRCVLHSTQIGNLVRDNRKMFLHKGSWHKRKGYAFSQLHKMGNTDYEGVDEILKFENDHKIDKKTKLIDVEKEMKNRGMLLSK